MKLKHRHLVKKRERKQGFILELVNKGLQLSNPPFDPMPEIGKGCYDLHVKDSDKTWRIIIQIDADYVVILEVFVKKTQKTPEKVKKMCIKRLKRYKEIT